MIVYYKHICNKKIRNTRIRKTKENDRNTMYTTIKSELTYNAPTIQYIQTIYSDNIFRQYIQTIYLSKTDTTI